MTAISTVTNQQTQEQQAALLNVGLLTRDLHIGVVGCGYWGPKLARNFHELPGATLTMLCDQREDRRNEVAALYPEAEVTSEFQQLLDSDVDGIVIATPVRTHYPLAKQALLAGKHVLVEKPVTHRAVHAEELATIAAERGLTLMVGHTFMYNPAVEAVRKVVQTGELGRVLYVNSTRANLGLLQPDINVMWDLGPHDISMIQHILGSNPISVSARGAAYFNTYKKLQEVVYVVLFFENGVMASLRLSWLDPVKQRNLTIVGDRKMLTYDDIADDKVVVYDKGVDMPVYSVTEEEFHASYRHGQETVIPLEWVEPLKVECNHFMECIRTNSPCRSGGENGLMIVRVLETAQRSLMNGGAELQIEYS